MSAKKATKKVASKRGGKRAGSGRKTGEAGKVTTYGIGLTEGHIAKLKLLGPNRSKVVQQLIEKAKITKT